MPEYRGGPDTEAFSSFFLELGPEKRRDEVSRSSGFKVRPRVIHGPLDRCVCVYYCSTYYKRCWGGGGDGELRTCAKRDYKPSLV